VDGICIERMEASSLAAQAGASIKTEDSSMEETGEGAAAATLGGAATASGRAGSSDLRKGFFQPAQAKIPGAIEKTHTLVNIPEGLSEIQRAGHKITAYEQMDLPVLACNGERTSDQMESLASFRSSLVTAQGRLSEQDIESSKDILHSADMIKKGTEAGRLCTASMVKQVP
jgi:hypothetical protein